MTFCKCSADENFVLRLVSALKAWAVISSVKMYRKMKKKLVHAHSNFKSQV